MTDPKSPTPPPADITLRLRPLTGARWPENVDRRLARLLKYALHACGLRDLGPPKEGPHAHEA